MKFPKNPDGFTILKFTDSIYLLKSLEYYFFILKYSLNQTSDQIQNFQQDERLTI